MLISIPMAVYNGAELLDRSIQSVISQTCGNWELICVDDGSTDNTAQIISKYVKLDSRVKYIWQENAGPASARVRAYRASSGDFVLRCLDHDDYIEPDFVKSLTEDAQKSNADVVLCDWLVEKAPNQFSSFVLDNGLKIGQEMTGREAFELTFPWTVHGNGLVSRELIDAIAIDDQYAFNSYDADEFLTRVIFLASKSVFIGSAKYFHCLNQSSITRTPSFRKIQSLDTNERLIELARKHGMPERVVWKIILSQRHYLWTIFKMLAAVKGLQMDRGKFSEAVRLTGHHFARFKREVRKSYADAGIGRAAAELIILKLGARHLEMRLKTLI